MQIGTKERVSGALFAQPYSDALSCCFLCPSSASLCLCLREDLISTRLRHTQIGADLRKSTTGLPGRQHVTFTFCQPFFRWMIPFIIGDHPPRARGRRKESKSKPRVQGRSHFCIYSSRNLTFKPYSNNYSNQDSASQRTPPSEPGEMGRFI
jgi:hypothetical protein